MNDANEFWEPKRGRPRKILKQICLGSRFQKKSRISESETQFRSHQLSYIENNFTQKMKIMIFKFLAIVKDKIEYNIRLFVVLEESFKEMMISEIELGAFAVIFSKLDLKNDQIPIEELIKLCLFSVKVKIDNNIETIDIIRCRLKLNIIDFTTKLALYIPNYNVTVREINKWLRKISNHFWIAPINYSFYINEIMRLSPPYKLNPKILNLNKKKSGRQIKNKSTLKESKKKEDCKEIKNHLNENVESLFKNDEIKIRNYQENLLGNFICDEVDIWGPKQDFEYDLEKLD